MGDISAYSRHMVRAAIYLAPILSMLLLGVVLNVTNPLQAGPPVILLVFVLIYLLVLSVMVAVSHAVGAIIKMLRPQKPFSLRRWYYVLSVASLGPVFFVALNTLGQLEIIEVLLITVLIALGCFYVLRRSAK